MSGLVLSSKPRLAQHSLSSITFPTFTQSLSIAHHPKNHLQIDELTFIPRDIIGSSVSIFQSENSGDGQEDCGDLAAFFFSLFPPNYCCTSHFNSSWICWLVCLFFSTLVLKCICFGFLWDSNSSIQLSSETFRNFKTNIMICRQAEWKQHDDGSIWDQRIKESLLKRVAGIHQTQRKKICKQMRKKCFNLADNFLVQKSIHHQNPKIVVPKWNFW